MKNKGFSLVELIVVIAIMAILVGVAVPVYTSYIEKAQKAKDEQMVDEIKHAIEIAAVGDSWATKFAPGVVGTIVITDQGMTVNGTTITVNGTEVEPLEDALVATFGDLSGLKLSYDGWTGTLNAGNIAILSSSAYSQNVSGLLGTVQNVTDMFAKYYEQFASDVEIDESAFADLGVDISNATQVANAMVIAIADASKNIELEGDDGFASYWAYAVPELGGFSEFFGEDEFSAKAAQYAYVQALVQRCNCTVLSGEFAKYNTGDYKGSNPYSAVLEPHIETCNSCKAVYDAYVDDEDGVATADAKAYFAILDQVSSSKDVVVENIGNQKLYSDSPLTQYVSSYISVAELMQNANASDGDVVLVVTMDSLGVVTVNVYPLEY